MGENYLRNIIPSPDHQTMEDDGCRSELTHDESDSSGYTLQSSHPNGNATPQGQLVEWTNEKHNDYLNLLEASFVEQLHQLRGSMGLGGWRSQDKKRGPYSSQALSANVLSSSGQQLMVLRDGRWQKIKFEGNEPLYDNAAVNSPGMGENPWICRFTSAGKHCTATSFNPQKHGPFCNEGEDMTLSCEQAGSSLQHLDGHLCDQNSVDSTTEVSDQNFVNEDQADKSSCERMENRLKRAAVDASSDDQVVPFAKPHTPDVSTVNRPSSEREEGAQHELFLERPHRFTRPRSDMHHHILRGS